MATQQFDTVTVYYTDGILPGTMQLKFKAKYSKAGSQFMGIKNLMQDIIASSDRAYDPQNKVWTVTTDGFERFRVIMWTLNVSHYKDARMFTTAVTEAEKPKFSSQDFFHNTTPVATPETKESIATRLAVLLGLPAITTQSVDELKRLYRRKALELHPDRNNGDGSKMADLNSLWSTYNAS